MKGYKFQPLINKFPLSWIDFRVNLKHRKEALTMNDLMSYIQIKEKHREINKKPILLLQVKLTRIRMLFKVKRA